MKLISDLIEHVTIDDIYQFMTTGNLENAPEEIVAYLKLLDKVNGMINRFDVFASENAVIKHLMLVDGISKYKAKKVYAETLEYFYKDQDVSDEALRNFYAKKADQILNFSIRTMETVTDAKKAIEIIKEIWTFRDLYAKPDNEIDESELSPRLFIYDTDPIKAGLPKRIDRNKVKKWINEKLPELTELEKQRIFQEADILPFEIFPEDAKDPRKS